MRFESIVLTAYGHFTDSSLDLSDPQRSVHVIYGPNEAGKTTVKDAIEELLFGFHAQTPYSFKHSYTAMSLGATITNAAGARISFVRRKRQRGSDLFTPANEQLTVAVLTSYIGGLTRESYANQFSLTREKLISGSREIAAGKGEVGESLYNAALGNASLAEIIARLEARRDALFAPGARTRPLNVAISRYETERIAAKALALRPEDWDRVVKERDGIVAQITEIERQIGENAALTGLLTSLRSCYQNYDRVRIARVALEEAANEPRFATDVVADVDRLLAGLADADGAIATCAARIERLQTALGAEDANAFILQRAVIDDLKGEVNTYRNKENDLRERDLRGHARRNSEEAKRSLEAVWPGLSLDDARKRVIQPVAQSQGNALVLKIVRLGEQCRNAADEEQAFLDLLAEIDAGLAGLPAARNLDALRGAVAAAAADGRLDTAVSEGACDLERKRGEADAALAGLPLFAGTLDELDAAPVPVRETVMQHANIFDELRQRGERIAERREDARGEQADATKDLDAMAREGEIITIADLTSARAERDMRYASLASCWRAGVAIADVDVAAKDYEPAVVEADRLADTLRLEAARVTRIATLEARLAASTAEIERLNAEIVTLDSERAAAVAAWEVEWAATAIVPRTPAEMQGWLQQAIETRRCAKDMANAEAMNSEITERRSRLRAALVAALRDLGVEPVAGETIEPVLGIARDILGTAEQAEVTRAGLITDKGRQERAVAKHRRDTAKAQGDLHTANQEFSGILERTWLSADTPAASFADMITTITAFHTADRRARDDKSRADGIDRDNAAFRVAVITCARDLAPDLVALAEASPDVAANTLADRLANAQTAHDQRAARLEEIAAERDILADVNTNRATQDTGLIAILEREGATRDVLPALLERSRILNAHAVSLLLETESLETGTGLSLAECDEQYGDRDRAALDNDSAVASARAKSLSGERDMLSPRKWELDERLREMDGSDAAAVAESVVAAIGAEVDHDARRWAEMALALYVLKEQIRQYAEANQGVLIGRASHYLSMLTNGAYEKLRAVNEGEANVLEAVQVGGNALDLNALSEGTSDQLYLALRLAALEEYLKSNEPQPLILDDAFVAFDDQRTELAFRALAEISEKTQVLYFTHHAACVAAARAGVPEGRLMIHDLSEAANATCVVGVSA